jgi:hypothetical protein
MRKPRKQVGGEIIAGATAQGDRVSPVGGGEELGEVAGQRDGRPYEKKGHMHDLTFLDSIKAFTLSLIIDANS